MHSKELTIDLLGLLVSQASRSLLHLKLEIAFGCCLDRYCWRGVKTDCSILLVLQETGDMLDQKKLGDVSVSLLNSCSALVTDFALFTSFSSNIDYFTDEKKMKCFCLLCKTKTKVYILIVRINIER